MSVLLVLVVEECAGRGVSRESVVRSTDGDRVFDHLLLDLFSMLSGKLRSLGVETRPCFGLSGLVIGTDDEVGVLTATLLNVTSVVRPVALSIRQVSSVTSSILSTHFEMMSLQVSHKSIHLGLVGVVHLVLVRLGSKRTRRNLLFKVAVLIMTNEISFRIGIAHGVTLSRVVRVEWQVGVCFRVSSPEGQRACAYLEIALGKLNSLVGDHLLIDICTSESLMCNGSAGVVVS